MDQVRINFGEGNEYELTPVEPWMRNLEIFRLHVLLVKEEQIEIDLARAPSESLFPAKARLNDFERLKKLLRLEIGLDLNGRVYKAVLGSKVDGFCFVKGRLIQ